MKTGSKTADVRIRIEPALKGDASQILADCGLTLSDAFRLFLRQVVAARGLPFPVMAPNAETLVAMREADSMRTGRFATGQELFNALEKDVSEQTRQGPSSK